MHHLIKIMCDEKRNMPNQSFVHVITYILQKKSFNKTLKDVFTAKVRIGFFSFTSRQKHQFKFLFNFVDIFFSHDCFLPFFRQKISFDCKEAHADVEYKAINNSVRRQQTCETNFSNISCDNSRVDRMKKLFPYFWCCVKIDFNQTGFKADRVSYHLLILHTRPSPSLIEIQLWLIVWLLMQLFCIGLHFKVLFLKMQHSFKKSIFLIEWSWQPLKEKNSVVNPHGSLWPGMYVVPSHHINLIALC